MRTVRVRIAGKDYDLVPSWAASLEIAEQVGDPYALAYRSNIDPAHIDTRKVVRIVHIALKHSGHEMPEGELGERMFADGMLTYFEPVGEYIGLLVAGPNESVRARAGAGGKKSGNLRAPAAAGAKPSKPATN